MIDYEVYLKTTDQPMPIVADKFVMDGDDVVFYGRPAKNEPFEEIARFTTSNIKRIKES